MMRWLFLLICAHLAVYAAAQNDPMAKREAKVRRQLAKDRPYKAISLCTGALGLEDRPVFHLLRADARNRIGEFATAETDARIALNAAPDDPEAMLQLALAEQGIGQTDSAVARMRRALVLRNDPFTRYRLATALQAAKDYPSAIVELDAVAKALPAGDAAFPRILRSRAECLALAGDTTGAQRTFQEALDLVPDDPVILNSRAWFLYAANGAHLRAVADYDKAIKKNPNYSYAFNNRGWSKFQIGDTEGALKDIHLARKKKPMNPYIYRNLGAIAAARGDTNEACAQFRRALDLNFTAVYGDEVERLIAEYCGNRRTAPPAPGVNPPDNRSPAPTPPTRTNAPE